ncbi:hypothetical protein ACTFIR_005601 [Dictyostelium discoideum]
MTTTTATTKTLNSVDGNSIGCAIYPAVASKVAQQTYNIPNNLIYAVVYQDGYLLPGGQLGINNIGSFTTSFGNTNTLSFSDGQTPDGDSFNLEANSPQLLTNPIQSQMNSSSETNTITDYGVNEMPNPVTMESSWIYYQQLPFDVYTWGYLNFGDWYQSAYSDISVFSNETYLSYQIPLGGENIKSIIFEHYDLMKFQLDLDYSNSKNSNSTTCFTTIDDEQKKQMYGFKILYNDGQIFSLRAAPSSQEITLASKRRLLVDSGLYLISYFISFDFELPPVVVVVMVSIF